MVGRPGGPEGCDMTGRDTSAGAAPSTVEALIYDVRRRGLEALADRSKRYRIADLLQCQLEEACSRAFPALCGISRAGAAVDH